ncbi:MAG: glycoside hydrolase family 127 protein [Phycisphaerae bacterium]|jgi:hypothetical protein|nr:glycoside hydrolase family 127 protein [Phycisphaerae bacterium]
MKMKKLLIALTTALATTLPACTSAPQQTDVKYLVAPKIPIKARAFSLKDVRLSDGPFKSAMDLDAKYLLELEPDRLLALIRKRAGLEPKAEDYGGWERLGLTGHILGHYMSACSMMYAASGDKQFADRVNYIVDELEICQKVYGNGYVGGVPEAKRIFAELAAGKIEAKKFGLNGGWVPWYNLHKLYAGLVDAHRYCNNEKAKTIVVAMTDWADKVTGKLTADQFETMFQCEIGGMNEVLADIYALTARPEHLKLATRFNHRFVLDPLSKRQDRLEGLHANTQVPKVVGAARQYELTGNRDLRTAAEFFWEEVVRNRSYVNGGNSEREHFRSKGELWKRLTPSTAETCNTYNMLRLTRHLFAWTADTQYADYYERALYNHILASQEPGKGATIYFCSLKPGHFHTYNSPDNSFWCCTGSGLENHVKYGDSIYFHDDKSLYVNLFIASELTWRAKGLKISQQTKFPYEPKTRFVFDCDKPVRAALKIRHPSWAGPVLKITVNGRKVDTSSKPGQYLSIDRLWSKGDTVNVALPMSLRLEAMENAPQRVAIMYGPILLAGQLGRAGFTGEMPYAQVEHRAYNGTPTPDVPDLTAVGKPVDQWVKPIAGKPLEFKTVGVGRPADISLIPFYKAHHQRYTVYWDLTTEQAWKAKDAKRKDARAILKDLAARTVDSVTPLERSEKAHNFKDSESIIARADDQPARYARDGAWFSYDMKLPASRVADMTVTYVGAEDCEFDIQVDKRQITTQTFKAKKNAKPFNVTYTIPMDLCEKKDKVTVRFQARKGKATGRVLQCRLVKRKN